MNKRGAETTIGTIVVVILAVLVLVVVVAGFAMGWNNLWSRLNPFLPKALSPDVAISTCDNLCLANQKYSYCCDVQKVNVSGTVLQKSCHAYEIAEELPITCGTITQDDCDKSKCPQ